MEETSFSPPPPPGVPPPGEPPVPPAHAIIPWEDPSRPWFAALVETVKLLLTAPRQAYLSVPVRGDILKPLIFALILGWAGMVAAGVYNLIFGDMQMAMMPQEPGMPDLRAINRVMSFVFIFLGPVLVALSLLFSSALTHLSLKLMGKAKHGFAATFRAVCYSLAPQFLCLVPFCGSFIGGVWTLVLEVIGISTLQSVPIPTVIMALILPAVLACCCIFGVAGIAGMFAGMQGATP